MKFRGLLVLFVMSFHARSEFYLEAQPKLAGNIQVKVADLCQVAQETLAYLQTFPNDSFAVHAGESLPNVSLARVKKTLVQTCKMDRERSLTAEQLIEKFDFYRWLPNKEQAIKIANQSTNKVKTRLLNNIPADQLFITKYYTKLLEASPIKTDEFPQALYAIPYDESALTLEEADKKKHELTRYKFSRQEVIAGALAKNALANPLIWLTEEALHDVLLQGTGVVELNGKKRYFNVHRNNGIAYDYSIGKREQARYWYFSEVPSILGYGKTLNDKISIKPDVTFAGNVKQLGLGKLFLIQYNVDETPIINMGVLADQGGAFDNNLFQLDYLKGSYSGWKDYYQANKHLPDYADTWMLLIK